MARVLVVEDEPSVLLLAKGFLERAGHEVVTVHSLMAAHAIIGSKSKVDLVFTVLHLGAVWNGGVTIAELAAQARPGIPVLYTSGESSCCTPFLRKPYTEQELVDAVAAALRPVPPKTRR